MTLLWQKDGQFLDTKVTWNKIIKMPSKNKHTIDLMEYTFGGSHEDSVNGVNWLACTVSFFFIIVTI